MAFGIFGTIFVFCSWRQYKDVLGFESLFDTFSVSFFELSIGKLVNLAENIMNFTVIFTFVYTLCSMHQADYGMRRLFSRFLTRILEKLFS